MSEVTLTGRAELDAIFQSLKKIGDEATASMNTLETLGKKTHDTLDKANKKNESNIKKTGAVLRRLAGQLYSDFKGLLSLQSLAAGMKLSNQFAGSVKESIKLSDTVRRLGNSFGVAKKDFGFFQAFMAKGLGDIGASSEAAADALQGLAGFGVSGIESATGLAKGAVTLAGMSGDKGNEKGIAAGIAQAIQSQGKDVNDTKAQQGIIGEVTAAVQATGKSASEILGAMNEIFSSMPEDLRKTIGPKAMAQMATMAATAGPQATKALQEYLSKSTEQRLAMEAQGFNVFKGGQLDMGALQSFIKTTEGRGISPRESLKSAGFSDEAAEGLVRLGEKADLVKENLKKLSEASRDNVEAYKKSMGLLDSFKGTINTVKGYLEVGFMGVSQKANDLLQGAVGSPGKSAAVVGGAAVLASVLAGRGIKGLFRMGGSELMGAGMDKARESITGEHVQMVRVINFGDMPGGRDSAIGPMGAGAAAGGGGKVAGALKLAAAGAIGYEIGDKLINPLIDQHTQGETSEGFKGNVVERLFFKIDKLLGGDRSAAIMGNNVKVKIETKEPNLVPRTGPTRGMSN